MNVVIPFDPFVGSVFAYTSSVEASGPFVILQADQKISCCPCRIPTKPQRKTHQNLFPLRT